MIELLLEIRAMQRLIILLLAWLLYSCVYCETIRPTLTAIKINHQILGITKTPKLKKAVYLKSFFNTYEPDLGNKDSSLRMYVAGQQFVKYDGHPYKQIIGVSNIANNSLATPVNLTDIFIEKRTTTMREYSFYRVNCPKNYVSLGDIAKMFLEEGDFGDYACIHKDFAKEAEIGNMIWDGEDKKSKYHMKGIFIWEIVPKKNTSERLQFYAASNERTKPKRKVYTLDEKGPSLAQEPGHSGKFGENCNRLGHLCHKNAECINGENGQFTCQCKTDYVWDSRNCVLDQKVFKPNFQEQIKNLPTNITSDNANNLQTLEDSVIEMYTNITTEIFINFDGIKTAALPINIRGVKGKQKIPAKMTKYFESYNVEYVLAPEESSTVAGILSLAEINVERGDEVTYGNRKQIGKGCIVKQDVNKMSPTFKQSICSSLYSNHLLAVNLDNKNDPLNVGVQFGMNKTDSPALKNLAVEMLSQQGELSGVWSFLIGHRVHVNSIKTECVYLNYSTTSWSTSGCRATYDVDGDKITCTCDHMTMFAVLLSMESITIPSSVEICAAIAELLSIISLLATLAILIWLRKSLNTDRTTVQINLSLSLLFLHIFNLFNDTSITSIHDAICVASTILIHYFLLSSAMWMLIEAVLLYSKTAMHRMPGGLGSGFHGSGDFTRINRVLICIGWTVPLIVVVVSAAIGFHNENYMDYSLLYLESTNRPNDVTDNQWSQNNTQPAGMHAEDKSEDLSGHTNHYSSDIDRILTEGYDHKYERCWLSEQIMVLWAAIVPLGVIFTVNGIILLRITSLIWKLSKNTESMRPTNYGGNSQQNINSITTKEVSYDDSTLPKRSRTWRRKYSVEHIQVTVRALFLLFPILGLPWLFAFLVNVDGRLQLLFMYLNAILNGSQGFFVFILYCVIREEVRLLLRRKRKNAMLR